MHVKPDFRVRHAWELCPHWCLENSVDTLLLDVDGTLRAEHADGFKDKVLLWIKALKAQGINICLVSNAKEKKIRKIAMELDVPYVAEAEKPSSLGIKYAMDTWKYNPATTVMVGDSECDIVAGYCAQIRTILVKRIQDKKPKQKKRRKIKKHKGVCHDDCGCVEYRYWWDEL